MLNQLTHCKLFSNSDQIVSDLEEYVSNDRLHENTQFITFSINDIGAKFSHQIIIEALQNFLRIYDDYEFGKTSKSITNDAMIELVRLVLQNQFFVYENKLYRQVCGGASGSLLTMPLACIYLFYSQSPLLILTLKNSNDILGR
jgi:hypothetical protein